MKILSLKKGMDKFRVTSWISSKVNFELVKYKVNIDLFKVS